MDAWDIAAGVGDNLRSRTGDDTKLAVFLRVVTYRPAHRQQDSYPFMETASGNQLRHHVNFRPLHVRGAQTNRRQRQAWSLQMKECVCRRSSHVMAYRSGTQRHTKRGSLMCKPNSMEHRDGAGDRQNSAQPAQFGARCPSWKPNDGRHTFQSLLSNDMPMRSYTAEFSKSPGGQTAEVEYFGGATLFRTVRALRTE